MGANGIDLIASNKEVDTREDNLLANRGCKIQTAQTTTPLLPEQRRLNHLSTERFRVTPCVNGVFFLNYLTSVIHMLYFVKRRLI